MARYIDADKFEKEIRMEASESIADAVVRIVDRQLTADVEEVKHGKWVDDIQELTSPAGVTQKYLIGYKCSLCGRNERWKEPYCNCGAKMDGEADFPHFDERGE